MSRNSELFERALKVMPWGTQTNAKRHDSAMGDAMPHFVERASGCRFWDADGRSFLDYRSALGPVILGYGFPAVEDAVRAQLDKGVLFSMASPLEVELAERLCTLIPGLEQVRFTKTGNDANMAVIRLARAFTGRDRIVICGYHGAGDWFGCGTGRAPTSFPREGNGVPEALDPLVIRIPYGNVGYAKQVFREFGDEIAGVLAVPYDWNSDTGEEFLNVLREETRRTGALLMFDQVLTGFRLALAGAQEYYGIIPDLTTYAKAIANGYPLAAFGGRRDVMQMLNQVILTTTYAGETLSLAASLATLEVMSTEPVHTTIWQHGRSLMSAFDEMAGSLGRSWRSFGLPPAPQFHFSDDEPESLRLRNGFFLSLLEQGIFPARPFLLNYSHDEDAIDETISAFKVALAAVDRM